MTIGFRGAARQRVFKRLAFALLGWTVAGTALCAELPTCSDLATNPRWGLKGNPVITSVTTEQVEAQQPNSTGSPRSPNGAPQTDRRYPATPTFCQVDLNLSYLSDLKDGYAEGEKQSVNVRIALPEKGRFKERLMVQGGSGFQGTVWQTGSFGEGANYESYLYYAIRLGMIGATTDAGHVTADNKTFAVIQSTRSLNLGKLADWSHRATFYAMRWAKVLSQTYYGKPVAYTYYNGGSGGGYQGMGQLQNFAAEYDGFLIGAPAQYMMLQAATPWQSLVIRDMLIVKGKTLTNSQLAAARGAAIAACDTKDGAKDGLVADPRTCAFDAVKLLCAAKTAPATSDCLDSDQAAAVNMIWDGPRNKKGAKVWFGWDRTEPISALESPPDSTNTAIFKWAMKDLNFDPKLVYLNAKTRAAAGNPPGSVTFEDIATLSSRVLADYADNRNPALDAARARGSKVIQLFGNYDKAIFWRQHLEYYRQVARHFGGGAADYKGLQSWYRLFIMPGVGDGAFHTTSPDASGPAALDPFLALVNWVENGKAPDRILAGAGKVPGRTRPLCPYPHWAQYAGKGDINRAESFTCGGNLETPEVLAQDTLAAFKHENGE